jgi:hypothetical protein
MLEGGTLDGRRVDADVVEGGTQTPSNYCLIDARR